MLIGPAIGLQWGEIRFCGESLPPCCNFPVAVAQESVFVFSSFWGTKFTNSLFQYRFRCKTRNRISTEHVLRGGYPPIRQNRHTMVAYHDQLDVFGGAANKTLPNKLHCFDLDSWFLVTPADDSHVPLGSLFHISVVVGDAIFIFGGTVDNKYRWGEIFHFAFPLSQPLHHHYYITQ